jgi:hypothetical protein
MTLQEAVILFLASKVYTGRKKLGHCVACLYSTHADTTIFKKINFLKPSVQNFPHSLDSMSNQGSEVLFKLPGCRIVGNLMQGRALQGFPSRIFEYPIGPMCKNLNFYRGTPFFSFWVRGFIHFLIRNPEANILY